MQNFLTTVLPQLESITLVIGGIGVLIAGLGYAYGQFFLGKKQNSAEDLQSQNEVIQLRQNQITELRDLVGDLKKKMESQDKQHNEEMRNLHTELGSVKGQLLEKERQNKEYLEILQNRSPVLDKILVEIRDFMQSINVHMQSQNLEQNKNLVVEATVTRA